MLSPSPRLLWFTAIVAVPLCTAAGFDGPQKLSCFLALVAAAIAAAFDARLALTKLRRCELKLTGAGDFQLTEGRNLTIPLHLTAKPGPYEIAAHEPAGLRFAPMPKRATVGAAGSAEIPLEASAAARGRYRISRFFVRTRSPLNFWLASGEKLLELNFRVYPDLHKEPGADVLFHRLRSGQRHQRSVGRGREFERLREYAAGDSYEEIAWKATARRGRPVVRVFQVERTQDVYAILDASRLSARCGRLDRYVRAALLLALAVEAEGDNFGLTVFDERTTTFVRAGRGKRHYAHCREALFDLQASGKTPDFAELFTDLQLQVRRRALLLFLTNLEDVLLAENFLLGVRVLARKHVSVVGQIEDGADKILFDEPALDVGEIREQLARHLRWSASFEIRKSLERVGIHSCRLRQNSVASDLVAQYSDIKRRQVL